jgi:hypothetical protein
LICGDKGKGLMMMMNHDGGIATCIALHGFALLGSAWLFVLLLCMPNEKSIMRAFTFSLSCLFPSVFYSDALHWAGGVVKSEKNLGGARRNYGVV